MEIETTGIFNIKVLCETCRTELKSEYSRGDLEVHHCTLCYEDKYNEGFKDGNNSIDKEESV